MMAAADWYRPRSRFWHSSQLVEENVVVRGGCMPGIDDKKRRKNMVKRIDVFDINTREWRERKTKGDRHPGLSAVACASHGKYIYAYGGLDGEELNGVLSELNLVTLVWTQLSPSETSAGPMRKDASGIVHFGDGLLAVVCGYAYPKNSKLSNGGSSDLGSTFKPLKEIPTYEGGGWTNEIHIFDIESRTWSVKDFKGTRPPPCADFSLISVDQWRAVLYGGDGGHKPDSKDLYIIDFLDLEITKVQPADKKDPWPTIRLGQQAACCFGFGTKYAQLLMTGGRLRQQLPFQDMWLFDLMSKTWKEVEIPDNIRSHLGRWGHTTTTITRAAGLEEVLMFGGCTRLYEVVWQVKIDEGYSSLAHPMSFIFGFLCKEWKLLDVVDSNSDWNTVKTFDLDGQFTLGALYSMEQDGIPVLTELIENGRRLHSNLCGMVTDQDSVMYKWPTLHSPSPYEPTWRKLCSILQLNDREKLATAIMNYLKQKKDPPATTSTKVEEKIDTRAAKKPKVQTASTTIEEPTLVKEVTHQQLQGQVEEEESWELKYQQLAEFSNSTIKLLKEEKEKMREEMEILRTQQVAQLMTEHSPSDTRGDMNGTSVTTDVAIATQPNGDFELRGVDVCGETELIVTNSAQLFEWEGFGLKLHICEGTLPPGIDQCIVRIKASTSGQYQFSKGFHLVSAVFWLHCQPMCKFAKSITMEMEHCAKVENADKLTFVRAVSSQETLPYVFKKIGGTFSEVKYWGAVELNEFSGVATTLDDGSEKNKSALKGESEENKSDQSSDQSSNQREYGAIVFHTIRPSVTSYTYRIDFVVTWNTKAHLTPVKEEYKEKGAELDSELIVEFDSESITVDIPLEGTVVEGGWKIQPLASPVVLKHLVDSYEKGKLIPKCQFSANIMLQEKEGIPPLEHHVKLIGTKFPFNSLKFAISPPDNHQIHAPSGKRSHSQSDSVPSAKRKRESSNVPPPNLKSLTVLKWMNKDGKIEKFKTKSYLVLKWREIGNLLQIPYDTLELWVKEKRSAEDCCDAVIHHWLHNPTEDYPSTWEGFCELVEDCGCGSVARNLKMAVENAIS